MKFFKKLAISVHSHVENLADAVENREAISKSYIREYEQVAAQAKVKLVQLGREVDRLAVAADKHKTQAALWADRARKVHQADEAKALACVSRMNQALQAQERIKTSLKEMEGLKARMTQDVDQILLKLEALKRKHQDLMGRQVCNNAKNIMKISDTSLENDIEDLYTRWETELVSNELHHRSPDIVGDDLSAEFEKSEEDQTLRKALAQLIENDESGKEEVK